MTPATLFALRLLSDYPDADIVLGHRETEFDDDEYGMFAMVPQCECCGGAGSRHHSHGDMSVGLQSEDYTPRIEVINYGELEAEFDVCDECGEQIVAAVGKVRGLFGEKSEAAE